MEKTEEKNQYGKKLFSWHVDEFEKQKRSKNWYIIAITIALLLLLFSFFTANFLFAVIIIVVSLIIILHDGRNPDHIHIQLTDEGILINQKFYDFDEFKNFSIVNKPYQEVKNLYFEFKSVIKQRLSISLKGLDPLQIRKNLLKYLPEDIERTDLPLSEVLAKIFKL